MVGLLQMRDTMLFQARMWLRMMAAKGRVALFQALDHFARLLVLYFEG